MLRIRSAALALTVAATALLPVALPGSAAAQSSSPAAAMDEAQRKAIESVVRDYLMRHPEVILEAVEAMQQREKVAEAERARKALADNRQALIANPTDPSLGSAQADVVVVEFFDYQCGYCKTVQADVMRLVKDDAKVRVVFKEFPILSPASTTAAKAALAARSQGKYVELHNALMEQRGQLNDELILRVAKSVGLDTERLKKDMEAPEVAKAIAANQTLAEELGVRGTPAFVIGDALVPGAIKLEDMKRFVGAARGKS